MGPNFGGPLSKALMGPAPTTQKPSAVGELLMRLGIPANERLYLETLLGRQHPFTEADFTPVELAEMRKLVQAKDARADQKYEHEKNPYSQGRDKASRDAAARWEKSRKAHESGHGYVGYGDYPNAWDKRDPLATALGRFTYDKEKGGAVKVEDKYDFANEARAPEVAKYKHMGPLEKALSVVNGPDDEAETRWRKGPSNYSPVEQYLYNAASRAGSAYIGDRSVPVDVTLPPEAPAAPGH